MEGYKTFHQLLEALYATKQLKSWKVHNKFAGCTCILRFSDIDGTSTSDNQDTTATFRRKTHKQLTRDKERMDKFKRPNTRSKTKETVENNRSSDCEPNVTFSGMDLSPESICPNLDLDSDSNSFRLDTHVQSPVGASAPSES